MSALNVNPGVGHLLLKGVSSGSGIDGEAPKPDHPASGEGFNEQLVDAAKSLADGQKQVAQSLAGKARLGSQKSAGMETDQGPENNQAAAEVLFQGGKILPGRGEGLPVVGGELALSPSFGNGESLIADQGPGASTAVFENTPRIFSDNVQVRSAVGSPPLSTPSGERLPSLSHGEHPGLVEKGVTQIGADQQSRNNGLLTVQESVEISADIRGLMGSKSDGNEVIAGKQAVESIALKQNIGTSLAQNKWQTGLEHAALSAAVTDKATEVSIEINSLSRSVPATATATASNGIQTPSILYEANPALNTALLPAQSSIIETARAPLLDAMSAPKSIISLQTPIGDPGWDTEVSTQVRLLISRASSQAELRLNPPELGSLIVHITDDGEGTSVTFFAQNAHTRELLESSLLKLQSMFEGSGVKLADTEVSEHALGQEAEGRSNDKSENKVNSETESDAGNLAVTHYSQGHNIVDYYA